MRDFCSSYHVLIKGTLVDNAFKKNKKTSLCCVRREEKTLDLNVALVVTLTLCKDEYLMTTWEWWWGWGVEIEPLQTGAEKWTVYLEPILFHKATALVDAPAQGY